MKKKLFANIILLTIAAAVLGGCGDGEEGASLVSEVATITAEPMLSQSESAIVNYEYKYNTGEFTSEDYHALAALYQEAGRIREQRDLLEQNYRLNADEQALEILQSITVNIAEEDNSIRQEAQTMLNNLELDEFRGEAVNMITNISWFETMMPKLQKVREAITWTETVKWHLLLMWAMTRTEFPIPGFGTREKKVRLLCFSTIIIQCNCWILLYWMVCMTGILRHGF